MSLPRDVLTTGGRGAPPPLRIEGRALAAPVAAHTPAGSAHRSAARGVYLHIPFCARLCDYCDFARIADAGHDLMRSYVDALLRDVDRVVAAGPPHDPTAAWLPFSTVFVGGGTPTLLPDDLLPRTVAHVLDALPFGDDVEVTVEANPETVTEAALRALRDAGVKRVSMGAQSFAPHVLDALGRWHDVEAPLRALEAVRAAGIGRVNLDLIYGTPAERPQDWETTLATATETGVGHVSAYALTVADGTGLAARIRRGEALAPDEDAQADRMAVADEHLRAAGLERYEVSNWARPGDECRHNLGYWRDGNWLAFGAGAHGHWDDRRWWNVRPPHRYVELVDAGQPPTAGEERLTEADRRRERLMTGLRLAEGVRREAVEPIDERAARRLATAGLLVDEDGRLRVRASAMAVADRIVLELVA